MMTVSEVYWPAYPRGFPVGAIMTLQAGGEIRLKSRMIEGAEENATVEADTFLLDGQQRLTSLYQSLVHEGTGGHARQSG